LTQQRLTLVKLPDSLTESLSQQQTARAGCCKTGCIAERPDSSVAARIDFSVPKLVNTNLPSNCRRRMLAGFKLRWPDFADVQTPEFQEFEPRVQSLYSQTRVDRREFFRPDYSALRSYAIRLFFGRCAPRIFQKITYTSLS
jgi:hypothetical protein